MDELRTLTTFAQVSQHGSFTEAARHLGMTTAAVSKIIMRLERHLDTRLFKRTTRQLSLTSEGRLFLDKVKAALAQLNQGMDMLREGRHEPAGLVRVLTNAAFGKDHLLPRMAAFLERYPKVDLDIRFDDSQLDLIKEGYDMAIQVRDATEKSYISRRLCDLPLVLVASPAYLARRGIPRSVEDLRRHECITVRLTSGQNAAWEFRRLAPTGRRGTTKMERDHYQPKGRLIVVGQYDAVLDAALAGLGPTVVFAHSVLRYLRSGELKVLLPDYRIKGGGTENTQIYLCYPHREYLPFNVRVLVEYLVESFRDYPEPRLDPAWFAVPQD